MATRRTRTTRHGNAYGDGRSVVEMVYEAITEWYDNWRKYGRPYGKREPCISVGLLKENLDQGYPEYAYRVGSPRQRYNMIRSALGKLVRAGKIKSSLGEGLRKGSEVRCYEPV